MSTFVTFFPVIAFVLAVVVGRTATIMIQHQNKQNLSAG